MQNCIGSSLWQSESQKITIQDEWFVSFVLVVIAKQWSWDTWGSKKIPNHWTCEIHYQYATRRIKWTNQTSFMPFLSWTVIFDLILDNKLVSGTKEWFHY
jgi:hypothetical protein